MSIHLPFSSVKGHSWEEVATGSLWSQSSEQTMFTFFQHIIPLAHHFLHTSVYRLQKWQNLYLKPHNTGLGLPGFLFLFLLFLKAEIIFFHKVLTTMCKQICASEEVKQTILSFPYYPQGGAVVLSLTHFRSFKKKEQKNPTFISFVKLFCPHKQKKQILEYLKGRMSVSFQMSLLTSHDSEKTDFSKLQNIRRAMSAVSHVKVPLPQCCTLLHICTPPFEDRLELQRCTHLWCCTLHPCTHHWHNFFHLLIILIKSHTEFCHWPFNNS